MERIYLGDWLYNAGIVGFLKINNHLWNFNNKGKLISKNETLLKIGDNYIEFDRKIFEGFADRFFEYSFKMYMNFFNHLERLESIKERKLNKLEEAFKQNNTKEVKSIWKEILKNIKEIDVKKKYCYRKELPNSVTSFKEAENILNAIICYLKSLPSEVKNKKAVDWFRVNKLYQKNWLNSLSLESFKEKYEKTLIANDLKSKTLGRGKEKLEVPCYVCYPLRVAKKGKSFSTSLSPFAGLNADVINFMYLEPHKSPKRKVELPLCDVCEIIYFSYFAGLIPVKKSEKTHFFFVNSDSSVSDLLKENLQLEHILKSDLKENFLIEFFTELLLEAETRKAKYTLQNIAVIELNLNDETMPRIHSFNLSKEKAEFFESSKLDLKRLSKLFYGTKKDGMKKERFSILPEVVRKILNSSLNYSYLAKLVKFYINKVKPNYETNVETYHLQILNTVTAKFLDKIILRGKVMNVKEKELRYIYKKGEELARKLKNSNAENKIQSIAYRLLNALRIGNLNQFMDVLIRTYMAYGEEIPSSFVKAISDQQNFYPIGYSFLNGLLGKEKGEVKQDG